MILKNLITEVSGFTEQITLPIDSYSAYKIISYFTYISHI